MKILLIDYFCFLYNNKDMKVNFWNYLFLILIFVRCAPQEYFLAEVNNPVFQPNVCFYGYEDLTSPKFGHLKEKYQLDTIFHGEKDELKRILLLRHWIKRVIKIEDFGEPYPGDGYVERILDEALGGVGFHCGHFSKVQNGVMNAYGYVTRNIGAGPGVQGGPDGHHGVNEIWLNSCKKWFLSDAKYDHHFEKNGIPLSALEIRDEYLKNKAADIVMVYGPDRIPVDLNQETGMTKERHAQTYTWVEHLAYNDLFTVWPCYKELLLIYDDEYARTHTWIWDGKPHWTYAKPGYVRKIGDRHAIEWTANTIRSKVLITGSHAVVELISDTPNFLEYQVRDTPEGEWRKVESPCQFDLTRKKHEFSFRVLNLAHVTGPEHKVIVESK